MSDSTPAGESIIDRKARREIAAAAHWHGRSRMFISLGVLFALFAAGTALLSQLAGAPFTAPTERISHAIGISYIIPFAIGILGYFVIQLLAHWRGLDDTPLPERMKNIAADCFFLLMFVAVIYLHFQIKAWMPLVNPALYDEIYFASDEALRPLINAMAWVRGLIGGLSERTDYLYQLGFLAMFAFALWGHALSDRRWHYHNMYALLLMQMIGAYTYLIAPAVGPFMFEAGPNAAATEAQASMLAAFRQVQEQGAAWLAVHGGDYFTGPPAAMPSLHIAGAFIITYYIVKARSVLAPFMVMMTFWIMIESVVSRWHYVVDLPPGLLLAFVCILIANRVCRPLEKI